MAELEPYVREKTDALDAAGNTTAAIGKGFAIGSAALVSLALFGAFVTRIRHSSGDALFQDGVNMLEPVTFAFLIIGGMIPFAFAAMTMKSVGVAAMEMVMEVQRQFDETAIFPLVLLYLNILINIDMNILPYCPNGIGARDP